MKPKYLVLGATGSIGYAVVKALLTKDISTTILVRDYKKAIALFGEHKRLSIILGDIFNTQLLNKISLDKTHIFHGLNVSYDKWEKEMPTMTNRIIEISSINKSILIFPGNNYNYGNTTEPITEITPFYVTSELTKVRVKIEEMILKATVQGRIKALVVRLPEIWGPNVTNKSFQSAFYNAIKGKNIPWLYTIDVPQQLIYNLDAGRAIVELSAHHPVSRDHEVFHVAGQLHNSMRCFFKDIQVITKMPLNTIVLKPFFIKILGLLKPTIRAIQNLRYKYENTIILDDTKFKKTLPEFQYTSKSIALSHTIDWFKTCIVTPNEHQKKQKIKKAFIDFMADNLSIGVFPFVIVGIVSIFPKLQSFNVLFGVVAGIYWAPLTRNLFRKLFTIKK